MIDFIDFIVTPDAAKTKVKFHMNIDGSQDDLALDVLMDDDQKWHGMNTYRDSHHNNLDHADYLIALAQYHPYGKEYFMFGGIYKVEKIEPEIMYGHGYKLTLLSDHKEYIKRLIVKTSKPVGRNYNRWYETLQEKLEPEVYELAPSTKLGPFPGYQNVSLMHKDLRRIIMGGEPSWKLALSNVKGVYVITDTSCGKLYIGSASGNSDGIWQRWIAYADENNLTGGNKGLDIVFAENGKEHIEQNFKYSILEIFDTKTKVETIIERENYWKKVLMTKSPLGMNHN